MVLRGAGRPARRLPAHASRRNGCSSDARARRVHPRPATSEDVLSGERPTRCADASTELQSTVDIYAAPTRARVVVVDRDGAARRVAPTRRRRPGEDFTATVPRSQSALDGQSRQRRALLEDARAATSSTSPCPVLSGADVGRRGAHHLPGGGHRRTCRREGPRAAAGGRHLAGRRGAGRRPHGQHHHLAAAPSAAQHREARRRRLLRTRRRRGRARDAQPGHVRSTR